MCGFGLIILGSEILDGRVQDTHFSTTRALLAARQFSLLYTLILPDDPEVIETMLRWAMGRPEPFFCCGGIGSTPDDYTRQCAARAAGVPLEFHSEGVRILKEKFGKDATPERLRMVEIPQGSRLIPNPVNRVPGFQTRNGSFLPGFPEMAKPMAAWVLDTDYGQGPARRRCTLLLPTAREGDLVLLMEDFVARYPGVNFSSLPRFTATGTEVELGLYAEPALLEEAKTCLCSLLTQAGVEFRDMSR